MQTTNPSNKNEREARFDALVVRKDLLKNLPALSAIPPELTEGKKSQLLKVKLDLQLLEVLFAHVAKYLGPIVSFDNACANARKEAAAVGLMGAVCAAVLAAVDGMVEMTFAQKGVPGKIVLATGNTHIGEQLDRIEALVGESEKTVQEALSKDEAKPASRKQAKKPRARR